MYGDGLSERSARYSDSGEAVNGRRRRCDSTTCLVSPAAEARQPRLRCRAVAPEERAQEGERIAMVPLDHPAAVLDLHVAPAHAQPDACGQADERVAAEALATHHRFEQVGVALVGELE